MKWIIKKKTLIEKILNIKCATMILAGGRRLIYRPGVCRYVFMLYT